MPVTAITAFDPDACAIAWAQASPGAHRDGDRFTTLAELAARLDAADGAEPDWSSFETAARAVLEEAADLLAAAYLAHAWHRLEGAAGLARGLDLLTRIALAHHQLVHPPADRPRARRAAVSWLAERSARLLADGDPALRDAEAACARACAACDVFGEGLLAPLRRRLAELVPTASEPMVPAGTLPIDEREAAEAPVDAPTAAAAANLQPSSERERVIAELARTADWFERCEPHSPIGPLLRRAHAWSRLPFPRLWRELLASQPDARVALFSTLGVDDAD